MLVDQEKQDSQPKNSDFNCIKDVKDFNETNYTFYAFSALN